jgi:hypothetical protein
VCLGESGAGLCMFLHGLDYLHVLSFVCLSYGLCPGWCVRIGVFDCFMCLEFGLDCVEVVEPHGVDSVSLVLPFVVCVEDLGHGA